jgi:hypothetical protein
MHAATAGPRPEQQPTKSYGVEFEAGDHDSDAESTDKDVVDNDADEHARNWEDRVSPSGLKYSAPLPKRHEVPLSSSPAGSCGNLALPAFLQVHANGSYATHLPDCQNPEEERKEVVALESNSRDDARAFKELSSHNVEFDGEPVKGVRLGAELKTPDSMLTDLALPGAAAGVRVFRGVELRPRNPSEEDDENQVTQQLVACFQLPHSPSLLTLLLNCRLILWRASSE